MSRPPVSTTGSDRADVRPDEPGLGVLLFLAYRAIEQRVYTELRSAGFDATLAQGRLLARIGEHGNRLTELAEMGQVTKQTANFLVDQLERAGYVERVADPTDARARLIRTAERGRLAQAKTREVERLVETEWLAHLGSQDLAELRRIATKLRQITDPYVQEQ